MTAASVANNNVKSIINLIQLSNQVGVVLAMLISLFENDLQRSKSLRFCQSLKTLAPLDGSSYT